MPPSPIPPFELFDANAEAPTVPAAQHVHINSTPMTHLLSDLRRRLAGDAEGCDILERIAAGFAAIESCVNDLLHSTIDRETKLELVDVPELVADVLGTLSARLEAQRIETVVDVSRAPRAWGDREMLRNAVSQLALNAVEAMPAGGRLHVSSHEGAHGFELEVSDSGQGLCDAARRRAFEPFFSTKKSGTGLGLGLSIVYRIAEAHGGTCLAQNCPDGGAAFTLRIPIRKLKAAA